MPTLKIKGTNIVINLEKLDEDVWGDEADEKTVIISVNYLTGFLLNHSSHKITLYLSIKGLYNYTIDFHRGGVDKKEAKISYDQAVMFLTGNEIY
jgi:hypothetical protein